MGSRVRAIVSIALALALSAVLAGCAQGNSGQNQGTSTGSSSSTGSSQPKGPVEMKLGVVQQWLESSHSKPVTFAAQEAGCMNCHDGQTFTETGGGFVPRSKTSSVGAAGEPSQGAGPRDWVVATDCRVCHTGPGADAAKAGQIDIMGKMVKAGVGSVCVSCHNGWHPPGKDPQGGGQRAPHGSVQGDMVFSSNVSTVTSGTQTGLVTDNPHQKVQGVCVGCHVTGRPVPGTNSTSSAVPDHSMKVADTKSCTGKNCHSSDPLTKPVQTDLDGNGKAEPFQTEIDGLMTKLKSAIEKHAGGTFASDRGEIKFASGATPTAADYAAAYNYLFVQDDKSRGVHSPKFAASLLQASINSVGGK